MNKLTNVILVDYYRIWKLTFWLTVFLTSLINHDQTGFIKGRYIGENIRLIIDAMEYTKAHNIPGILVSLDYP